MAQAQSAQVKSSSEASPSIPETVTVACKLPHGLILRVYEMVDTPEPVLGGGYRDVKMAKQRSVGDVREVRVIGYVAPVDKDPKVRTFMGYAINDGVPKEFWEIWLQQNKDHDAVKNKLIFAMSDVREAERRVKTEFEGVRSGFEPLDPKNPMRGIKKASLTGSDPDYQAA
jgi:hypothetical protein